MTDVPTNLTTAPELITVEHVPPRGFIPRLSFRLGGADARRAKEIERFLKFAVVGIIGAIIDLGVTNILLATVLQPKNPADTTPATIAALTGFTLAVISNFIWNRYWTYPDSRSRSLGLQLVQFFAVNAVGFIIRLIILQVLPPVFGNIITRVLTTISTKTLTSLSDNGALLVALAVVMLWNFFINRYWTYNDVK